MSYEKPDQGNVVEKALSAFRWVTAFRFVGQLLSWLSTIIVIRFLAPEDYGVIAISQVFATFIVLFSTMGLSEVLIKVDHLEPQLIRKTLGLLVVVNTGLFIIQYLAAPYVADFYSSQDVEWVLQVLAFTYLLVPWCAVPSALIARNLDHKRSSKISFVGHLLASILSLLLAYLGYGYWALVSATVFSMVFMFVGLNLIQRYPRIPSFAFGGAGSLFKFGAYIGIADVLFVAYNKIDVGIAGRFFDVAEIGFYGVAIQLATMLMTKSMPLYNGIAFPAFSNLNTPSSASNQYLLTILRVASMVIFPIFFGVAVVGEDLINLILGSDWTEIAHLFGILAVSVPFRVLAYLISPAIFASGAATVNMTNSLATLVFLAVIVVLLVPFGLPGVATAWSLASVLVFTLTVVRGGRVLGLRWGAILVCALPAFLVSVIMCLTILGVNLSAYTPIPDVYFQVPVGALVYIGLSWLFFKDRCIELSRILLRLTGRR